MGLLDLVRGTRRSDPRPALEQVEDGPEHGVVTSFVQRLLEIGLDGMGPVAGARAVADLARSETGSLDSAIDKVVRGHLIGSGVGGFVTGIGGFVTMPIALPVNVFEFYLQATRMVGAIAHLRGYDLARPQVRTAVLLTLIGSDADDVLARAGLSTGAGRLTSLAATSVPPAAMLMINKGIGFRLIRGVGEKALSRLGRGIPVAGGVIGAGLDGYFMSRIAQQARQEFPPTGEDTRGHA